jgi:type II secretory ATPase GspE/PulE/Tfp pilus assembly ATPase PilB-like protein
MPYGPQKIAESFAWWARAVPAEGPVDEPGEEPPLGEVGDAPIARVANFLLLSAIEAGGGVVRVVAGGFRGGSAEVAAGDVLWRPRRVPAHVYPRLIARYKPMACLLPREHRTAQRGPIEITSGDGGVWLVDVQCLPDRRRESATLTVTRAPGRLRHVRRLEPGT